MTIKQKLNACYKVLFKNKPITTLTYGVRFIKCDDCEYNIKCDECFYMDFAKTTVKEIAVDAYSKFAERLKEEFRDNTDNNGDINSCLVPIIINNLLKEMAGGTE